MKSSRKKILFAFTAVSLMVLGGMSLILSDMTDCSAATSGTTGEVRWEEKRIDGNPTLVISGTGAMADYTFNGSKPWSTNWATHLIVEDGVTHIGNYAFKGMAPALKYASISDSVKSIGNGAFYYVSSLISVNIPQYLESLAHSAFYNCSGLTAGITIPSTLQSISHACFEGCTSIPWVYFEDGITGIPDRMFNICKGLASVRLPDTLVSTGSSAFSGSRLSSVVIPSSVTSIGSDCFASSILTNITFLSDSPPVMGMRAFQSGINGSITYVTVYSQGWANDSIITSGSTNTILGPYAAVSSFETISINVSDMAVVCGVNVTLTPVASNETVTVSGADWLTATGNTVSGTPVTPGDYTVTFRSSSGLVKTVTIRAVSLLDVTNSPLNGAIIMAS